MTTTAGVWVDHQRAVVVRIADGAEDTRRITADVGEAGRASGRSRSKHKYTPKDFVAEDRLERKFMSRLNEFYDDIIACLRDADAILILGPGEAKGELKKRIRGKKLRGRVAELETADKLTDRQVAASVRRHFARVPSSRAKIRPSRKRVLHSPPDPGRVPRDVGGEG